MTSSMDSHIEVRWMVTRDLDSIIKIENQAFDYPWSKQDFIKATKEPNCISFVAINDNRVVGYIIYTIDNNHYDILNLAVDAKYRRQRIATMLVNKVLRKVTEKRNMVITYIREKNLAAQLFFKKQDFLCTDIVDNYYNTNETAYLMEYKVNVNV